MDETQKSQAVTGISAVAVIGYFVALSQFSSGIGAAFDEIPFPIFRIAIAYAFVPSILAISIHTVLTKEFGRTVSATAQALVVSAAAFAFALGVAWVITPNPDSAVPQGPSEEAKEAEWILRGQKAVVAKLKDPDSAQFRDVIFHRGKSGVPVTCGEVNSKNSLGGYGGFQGFLSAGSLETTYLEKQLGAAEFAKVWNKLCAS